MITLHQPDKYKVYVGNGRGIGFCTVWNEPELIFKKSKTLREHSAILGTLYGRQGVNVIIRNLALNPSIRKIVLWGSGALSNTKFGIAGRSVLEKLWSGGVDEKGIVRGTEFKLEKEIDTSVIEKVRTNVELTDMSTASFEDVEGFVEKSDAMPSVVYMERMSFPDAVPEKTDTFPSETVGWVVHGSTILETWLRVVDRIMRYGIIKKSQYGNQQRELIGMTWVSNEPDPAHPDLRRANDWPENLRATVGATEESIAEYHAVFLSKEKADGVSYTYGNRLMAYPGPNGPFDQIEEVIKRELGKFPDSRRAVATTMAPWVDGNTNDPPCITQIQALHSNGKLNLLATARSHNIFAAAILNAFGLRTMQKKIADDLGFGLGALQITSQSAHIVESDWDQAEKLTRCFYWDRTPSMTYDPATESDPRGNFIITVSGGKITAALQSSDGNELARFAGENAKEVAYTIAHLDLISSPKHMMDIAMELEKAEIAMSAGIEYRQDRPLVI